MSLNLTQVGPEDIALLNRLDFGPFCDDWALWFQRFIFADERQGATRSDLPLIQTITLLQNVTDGFPEVADWNSTDWVSWVGKFWDQNTEGILQTVNGSEVNIFMDRTIQPPSDTCRNSLCYTLYRGGNTDVAGIGMVVTYWLEAVLVTLYLGFLLANKLGILGAKNSGKASRRILEAFKGSAKPFLDGAILFSLAMLLAALAAHVQSFLNKKANGVSDMAVYSNVVTVQLSIFTILPALLLHNTIDDLHRPWLRNGILGLLVLIALPVVVLAHETRRKQSDEDSLNMDLITQDNTYDFYCDTNRGRYILPFLKAIYAVFGAILVFWFFFIHNVLKLNSLDTSGLVQMLRRHWGSCVAPLCMLGMWAILGMFTQYRNEQIDIATDHNRLNNAIENSWTLGQWLALATFLPVFIDFTYIFLFGEEEGLKDRVSGPYEVRRIESMPSSTTDLEASKEHQMESGKGESTGVSHVNYDPNFVYNGGPGQQRF